MFHARGFTLIEILVVTVIMAIIIGSVSLTLFDSAGEKLEQEGHRLKAVITYAQQDAMLYNRQLALSFDPSGYQFQLLDRDRAWVPYTGDRLLMPHRYADPVRAEVYLDGIRIAFSGSRVDQPQVFILSSGEMQPFTVEFFTDDRQISLSGDALGHLSLTREP
ncbi:MAG: type II secretion system minor pseudopilin GspH [Chromatiales bacterium]|nr:type II secretion system minor pseudopilin GspH [Chromatiales bacterium]